MLRVFLISLLSILCLKHVSGGWIVNPGPKYPPTKGEIWPKPQVENKQDKYFVFRPEHFKFEVTEKTCSLLTSALQRFGESMEVKHKVMLKGRRHHQQHGRRHSNTFFRGSINFLKVTLTQPCEDYPHFGMNEEYNLTISTSSELKSNSVWGIIRGLESFVQLFYFIDDYSEIRLNYTQIIDYPRYPHRGLLLDTSRHYINMENILITLDAMAINKINVFHWHIVDDQSFPYQSERFPELSEKGAYHWTMIYTKEDIRTIIEYARFRGIRVLPEFDVPGHTRSWGVAYPSILVKCYDGTEVTSLGPMNPLNNATYKLLKDLFEEVQELFPEKYFHVGGDEVNLDCWASNPEILEYMNKKNISSVTKLHALFMKNAIPLLAEGTYPIVWQEVLDEGVKLPRNTIVQAWKSGSELVTILNAGYKALHSSSWYLDHLSTGGDWEDFYDADPNDFVNNSTLEEGIVGGETCMWGEVVDDRNVISRVWPRASAVAERLWSPTATTPKTLYNKDVRNRLEEHTCRMISRGVHAQPPNGPGFCVFST